VDLILLLTLQFSFDFVYGWLYSDQLPRGYYPWIYFNGRFAASWFRGQIVKTDLIQKFTNFERAVEKSPLQAFDYKGSPALAVI
jgi:hypothetical protein